MTVPQAIVSVIVLLFCATCSGWFSVNGLSEPYIVSERPQRAFSVDWANDRFLMDGAPFRYISGSFHYFRATPETWQRKIRLLKAAGLNAVSTYVEWSLHQPRDTDKYVWTGIANLERFLDLCKSEDMYVLLRPGPYICAERDLGGFPWWLLKKHPGIKLRTMDPDYLQEVEQWYSVLMPKMKRHLYGQGGNVILVQIENEYGSFGCDLTYTHWLRDLTHKYVQNDAVLYTTDGPSSSMLRCGHINDTVQSVDFGAVNNPQEIWKSLRKFFPKGPLINSEYYSGWLSHWQEPFPNVSSAAIAHTLNEMLTVGANVNFFMFYGGTNFGFTNGANAPPYQSQTTSYDYNAPLDEAGDPTDKFWAIRNVTAKYVTIDTPVPDVERKLTLRNIIMEPSAALLTRDVQEQICTRTRFSAEPLTFEELDQNAGMVIYEVPLPKLTKDPSVLKVRSIHDRASVYISRQFVGLLSRENSVHQVALSPGWGDKLTMIAENQGRVNYGPLDEFKGVRNVTIEGHMLTQWSNTGCPLENGPRISQMVHQQVQYRYKYNIRRGPLFLIGTFNLTATEVLDTFLDTQGWGKGVAFVNHITLGRYWPLVRPQKTLFIPKEFLKVGYNEIILLELQLVPISRAISLIDHHILE